MEMIHDESLGFSKQSRSGDLVIFIRFQCGYLAFILQNTGAQLYIW